LLTSNNCNLLGEIPPGKPIHDKKDKIQIWSNIWRQCINHLSITYYILKKTIFTSIVIWPREHKRTAQYHTVKGRWRLACFEQLEYNKTKIKSIFLHCHIMFFYFIYYFICWRFVICSHIFSFQRNWKYIKASTILFHFLQFYVPADSGLLKSYRSVKCLVLLIYFYFKNCIFLLGCSRLIKRDSKDIYIVTK